MRTGIRNNHKTAGQAQQYKEPRNSTHLAILSHFLTKVEC